MPEAAVSRLKTVSSVEHRTGSVLRTDGVSPAALVLNNKTKLNIFPLIPNPLPKTERRIVSDGLPFRKKSASL